MLIAPKESQDMYIVSVQSELVGPNFPSRFSISTKQEHGTRFDQPLLFYSGYFFCSKLNNMSFSIVHNVTDVFAKCRVLSAYFVESNKYNKMIPWTSWLNSSEVVDIKMKKAVLLFFRDTTRLLQEDSNIFKFFFYKHLK